MIVVAEKLPKADYFGKLNHATTMKGTRQGITPKNTRYCPIQKKQHKMMCL